MGNSRSVVERETDEGTELELTAVWSTREWLLHAARTGGRYALVTLLTGAALLLVYSAYFVRKNSVSWMWDVYVDFLQTASPTTWLYVSLPIAAAGLLGSLVAGWRTRSLAVSVRLKFDGETLCGIEDRLTGEQTAFRTTTDDVVALQKAPLERAHLANQLTFEEPYEMTLATSEEIYSFAPGLREGGAMRAVDQIEESVLEVGGDTLPWKDSSGDGGDGAARDVELGADVRGAVPADEETFSVGGFWRRYRLSLGAAAAVWVASIIIISYLLAGASPEGSGSYLATDYHYYFPLALFGLLAFAAAVVPVVRYFEYRRLLRVDEVDEKQTTRRDADTSEAETEVVLDLGEDRESESPSKQDNEVPEQRAVREE